MKTHALITRFRTFQGYLGPGFEAWFYGVKVRDWLFTGTSKGLPGGPVAVGHPPLNSEYFEWLALMAAVVSARSRFTMVECGAGWGRWLAAGAQLARQRGLALCLVGVEAEQSHAEWVETVLADNGVGPEERVLHRCAVVPQAQDVRFFHYERPSENYGQRVVAGENVDWLRSQSAWSVETVPGRTLSSLLMPLGSVDLVSVDTGSLEDEVVAEAMPQLQDQVRVLQIGTSSETSHARLDARLSQHGWLPAFSFLPFRETASPYGNVHFDQGLQVWVNPRSRVPLELIEQERLETPYPVSSVPPRAAAVPAGVNVFDSEAAITINRARMGHLDSLGLPLEGRTVLDVGCGVGHLAQFFVERNCTMTCVDVRPENIDSLRKRYPGLAAHVLNVEGQPLAELGHFDVVFCYDLLYHLENPLAALRNIASVTSDLLLLETVVSDHAEPLSRLADESARNFNQAIGGLACRPTPAFVAMALSRIGFPYVYAPVERPAHPDFDFKWNNDLEWSRDGHLLRCVFVAARRELHLDSLKLLIGGDPEAPGLATFAAAVQAPAATRAWIEVGGGLGETTFSAAQNDPALRVYAFEPDLTLASQWMGRLPNFVVIPSSIGPEDADTRLDSFLDGMRIREVEYLRIAARGAGLVVVRSAGQRLGDCRKISVQVQTTPPQLSLGASETEEALEYLGSAGFQLVSIEEHSTGQEETLVFIRSDACAADEDCRLLQRARALAAFAPPVPDPGWRFDAGWNGQDPALRERRAIWEHFHASGRLGPVEVGWLDGLRLTVYLGNDLSRQVFVLGRFEPNEFALLDRLLKPGMCFVDAGANEGLYTLFGAVRVGAAGSVWAFEPSPREFARLGGNCRRNRLEQVRLFRVALSDADGQGELAVAVGGHAGQNALCEDQNGALVLRRERVRLERLDALAQSDGLVRLDVFKIDVEGEEFRTLRGAERTIRRHRPVILFECSDQNLRRRGSSAAELKNLLAGWGYRLFGFDRATGLPVPLEPESESVNLVAAPERVDFPWESVR